MPDSRAPEHRPHGWDDAFAALPPETPPVDGWQRLAARLPASATVASRAPRWRRPVFAVAAATLLAAVVPLLPWRTQQAPGVPASPVAQRSPDPPEAAAPASRTTPAPAPAPALAVEDDAVRGTPDAAASPATHANTRSPPSARSRVAATARATDTASLDALYAESAQLEAVLAQLPDAGVQNAAALTLSADLHDQVAYIDAALSQPALDNDARDRLWRERVDALRRLAGVQATPHWQLARAAALSVSDTAIY